MKALFIAAFALGISVVSAQDITGDWNGILDVSVMQLPIVFHITQTAEGLSSTMDSPDQGAFGIAVTSTTFADAVLTLTLEDSAIQFIGELKDSAITGTFQQSGQKFPLILTREQPARKVYNRPQVPTEPYPYLAEEVTFTNPEAGIKLAGTLTLPNAKGKYPAVVLITGSGAHDRDETVFQHKPFLIIADYLARNGIASLRFDDRGTASSEGDFAAVTTLDFATDAASAVAYLKTRKEIGAIGLAGHSEGGIIAPIVASRSQDVKFIILLAGTGIRGDKVLLMQQEAIMRAAGEAEDEVQRILANNARAFELVYQAAELDSLRPLLRKFMEEIIDNGSEELPEGTTREGYISLQFDALCNPWMFSFIKLDPVPYLEQVRCPVLALNGAKDLQVPSKANLDAIRRALTKGGNKKVTTKEFPGLNHLFQECQTGLPEEYVQIEQTISPAVLKEMSSWIKKAIKQK